MKKPIPSKQHDFQVTVTRTGDHTANVKTTIRGTSIYQAAKAYVAEHPDIVGILYNGRWVD
jgi:hypothetical protein